MALEITRRGLLGTVLASAAAQAQPHADWPTKPVRIVQSGSAGGTSDILMRLLGEHAIPTLGQQFVIEPRPGGGGMIALNALLAVPADGYIFAVNHTQTHAYGPTIYAGRMPYDPIRDFAAVCKLVDMPNILHVRRDHPANSVAEFIAWCRANPARATMSASGPGASTHIGEVLLAQMAGIDIVPVIYRGSAPAAQAVVTGEVAASIENVIAVSGFLRAGEVKALGVTNARRLPHMPDVPAIAETLPGFEVISWFGLIARVGTPPPILDRFGAVLAEAMAQPAIRERLLGLGAVPAWLDRPAYEAFMRGEIERWAPVVRAAGVRPD